MKMLRVGIVGSMLATMVLLAPSSIGIEEELGGPETPTECIGYGTPGWAGSKITIEVSTGPDRGITHDPVRVIAAYVEWDESRNPDPVTGNVWYLVWGRTIELKCPLLGGSDCGPSSSEEAVARPPPESISQLLGSEGLPPVDIPSCQQTFGPT